MGARSPAVVAVLLLASCAGAASEPSHAMPDAPVSAPAAAATPTPVRSADGASVSTATPAGVPVAATAGPARLAFVGDLMLGRGVAPVVAADPGSVFERLRPALVAADVAFGNLESPLTVREHVVGEYALEADPAAAALLAGAGLDVLGVANNHAGDAGPETVLDSIAAVEGAGLVAVGGGATIEAAAAPLVLDLGDVRIGVIAVDLSGGPAATATTPGVNGWDSERIEAAVTTLSLEVDVVVVGVHGCVEYLVRPDPVLAEAARLLVEWGADVVWGHGAHVVHPVVTGPDRSVVAHGLGNALFDQPWPRTSVGALLEVLVDAEGPVAYRTGRIAIDAGRSTFEGWDEPAGDAVAFDGDWWTPVAPFEPLPSHDIDVELPPAHEVVARAAGDVTGTGVVDLVVSYRQPAIEERVHAAFPEVAWTDVEGRTAHLGVRTATGRLRWGSAFLFQPVGSLAVCDGSIALGFTTIDDEAIVGAGAWVWDGFGFRTAPALPGPATPGCADVDGDGRSEPVLVDRIANPVTDGHPAVTTPS